MPESSELSPRHALLRFEHKIDTSVRRHARISSRSTSRASVTLAICSMPLSGAIAPPPKETQ
jgi:hypothetical protein